MCGYVLTFGDMFGHVWTCLVVKLAPGLSFSCTFHFKNDSDDPRGGRFGRR
jgi:hypothetical protein